MATTNWSKVERLKLELRVGVAMRLMDRVPYGEIRAWLTNQGVLEKALPSDRSMHGYADTLEYGCLMQQRLDAHPELAGGAEPNPAGMGLEATGGALSADGFAASAKRWLTIRLMVAERTQKVYDHAAMMADRFEERLLMELEMACQAQDEDEEEAEVGGKLTSAGEPNTNKESLVSDGVTGVERQLLMAASKLPELSPEDLQREAFWMARRKRLERDPRMLKPAVFSRLMGQMMRIMKEAKEAGKTSGAAGRVPSWPIAGRGAALRPQPAALRADSAAFGARTGAGAGAATSPITPSKSVAPRPQAAPQPQPVELRADSAAFGARTGAGVGAVTTPITPVAPRPHTAPQPQPAALRADSAAFGARTAAGAGAVTTPITPVAPRPQAAPQSRPVGLRADSAAFGASGSTPRAAKAASTPAPTTPMPTTVEPAYAAAFYAAGRADGKGSLEDVPAFFIAKAHANGLTPAQAVRVARKGQLMIGSGASRDTASAQGHSDGEVEVRVG